MFWRTACWVEQLRWKQSLERSTWASEGRATGLLNTARQGGAGKRVRREEALARVTHFQDSLWAVQVPASNLASPNKEVCMGGCFFPHHLGS